MRAIVSDVLTLSLNLALLTALCVLAVPPAPANPATPALPITLSAASTHSAAPDRRACVTAYEYRAVQVGDSARKLRRVWDGYGREGEIGRVYRRCSGGHAVVSTAGAPSIVTLKYRTGAGSDPFGRVFLFSLHRLFFSPTAG
jgi:hypothetical protein